MKALDTMLAITAEKWVKISGMQEDGNGSLIRKMCVKDVSHLKSLIKCSGLPLLITVC